MSTFVISLGGSLVSPEAGRVDTAFLKKFRALILKYVKRGHRFAIIVGGGKVCRVWQDALQSIPPLRLRGSERGLRDELDWVGIRATQLNAEVVRAMFGNAAHAAVVQNPAQKVGGFRVLIGAGYVPGHSSDYDAVVRAKNVGSNTVVNLSNVAYVYDKDPRKFKNAKPLKKVSWKQYRKKIGGKYAPGMNAPFDPVASKTARASGIRVAFMDGRNLKNFENFLQGKEFKGTVIG